MKKSYAGLALGGFLMAMAPQAAFAQMMPTGAEITGHAVRVDANGVSNTVYFDPGGAARIVSASGREVQGTWAVENGQLCLNANAQRECWPYQAAFQTGQPVVLTSNCAATSSWTALSTNPLTPQPTMQRSGERG